MQEASQGPGGMCPSCSRGPDAGGQEVPAFQSALLTRASWAAVLRVDSACLLEAASLPSETQFICKGVHRMCQPPWRTFRGKCSHCPKQCSGSEVGKWS